jgi:hypothetical protein
MVQDNMIIAIPTKGRVDRQITYGNIPNRYKHIVYTIVPWEERKLWARSGSVIATPKSVSGISETRTWILKELPKKLDFRYVLMLDDDMDFCFRPSMGSPKLDMVFRYPKEFTKMMNMFKFWLNKGHIHVGLSARQGNNRVMVEVSRVTRMMNAYAYDVVALARLNVKFNRVPVMEDFDLTLQLLRMGHPNVVIYKYCWNQRGSNSEGGCSTYRTAMMQKRAALKLKKLHPDFVKVVEKEGWNNMPVRYDVNIQWKKAYASANL